MVTNTSYEGSRKKNFSVSNGKKDTKSILGYFFPTLIKLIEMNLEWVVWAYGWKLSAR